MKRVVCAILARLTKFTKKWAHSIKSLPNPASVYGTNGVASPDPLQKTSQNRPSFNKTSSP